MASTINATTSGVVTTGDSVATLSLQTGGTTAVAISTAQIVTLSKSLALLGSSSGSVTIAAPATAGTQSYTLPTGVPAANGYALTSTTGGVMSWAASGGGGKILQVVTSVPSGATSTSQTLASFATLAITPTSATSSIYFTFVCYFGSTAGAFFGGAIGLYNQTTSTTLLDVGGTDGGGYFQLYYPPPANAGFFIPYSYTTVDSPASTSAQTYQVQFAARSTSTGTLQILRPRIILMEVAP
jgi:hypothetical protein